MQASLSCITLQSWRAPFSCRTRLSHTCLEKITFDSRKRITLIHKRKHFTAKTTLPARAQSAQGLLTKDRVPQCVGPGKDFNGHHGRHGCLCHHGHHDHYCHYGRHGHQDRQVREDTQDRQIWHLNLTFQVTCDWQLSQILRCLNYSLLKIRVSSLRVF